VDSGTTDEEIVSRIQSLDAAVGRVDSKGLRETPFFPSDELASSLGVARVWVKDETGNVAGSHKIRHLAGIELWLDLHLAVPETRLAIASCGNAALAAAVVARATNRPLDVFVPPHAEPAVLDSLRSLDANMNLCERREGEPGDPCYLRFLEALDQGAIPFTCQGNQNALTIDGGKTLAWEMASTLSAESGHLDRVFLQVGGGALATATIEGLKEAHQLGVLDGRPMYHAVQTSAAHPLERAWQRVVDRILERSGGPAPAWSKIAERARLVAELPTSLVAAELAHAAAHRADFMWPWEETPASVADGILDDETYDWLSVVEGMLATGGYPVTVSEAELIEANLLARQTTGLPVDATGTAGLAGALTLSRRGELGPSESLAVLLTGLDRSV
jgi:threonine synthase